MTNGDRYLVAFAEFERIYLFGDYTIFCDVRKVGCSSKKNPCNLGLLFRPLSFYVSDLAILVGALLLRRRPLLFNSEASKHSFVLLIMKIVQLQVPDQLRRVD